MLPVQVFRSAFVVLRAAWIVGVTITICVIFAPQGLQARELLAAKQNPLRNSKVQNALRSGKTVKATKLLLKNPRLVHAHDRDGRTPLHFAAEFGHIEFVKLLLEKGADVNGGEETGVTPLALAEDPDIVELLLEHKANANGESPTGTALQNAAKSYAHYGQLPFQLHDDNPREKVETAAIRSNWRQITKLLLDAGAEYDIHSACYLGDVERVRAILKEHPPQAKDKTAMWGAAFYGHAAVVKLLLEHGGDPEDADSGGLTVSYWALRHPSVLKLLFDAGADPKVRVDNQGNGGGPQGSTLLVEAAGGGYVETAKLLIARGLDVNARIDQHDWTPLHRAARIAHKEMVALLLDKGAKPRAVTKKGWSAIQLAVTLLNPAEPKQYARRKAVIQALLEHGVEMDLITAICLGDTARVAALLKADRALANSRDPSGYPALHWAVGNAKIVKLLLASGCDVGIRNQSTSRGLPGGSALHVVAIANQTEIARILIDQKADVNATDKNGSRPLHTSALYGTPEVARVLLGAGADVNANDNYDRKPLSGAGRYGKPAEIVKLLLDHKADVNAADKHGLTALHHAARHGVTEAARLLLAAGADVNAKDKQGRTPLSLTNRSGKSAETRKLLHEHGGKSK